MGYHDEALHRFFEELSPNGCFIDEHCMRKGDTRALQHGDVISICMYEHATGVQKPFAACIFRIADHESDLSRAAHSSTGAQAYTPNVACAGRGASFCDMDMTGGESKNRVNDQWVRDH